jgi:hypothetical protein
MYRVVAQGMICFQGVCKATALYTYQNWKDGGEVVGLYFNDRQIASSDVDLLEDEDELVTSGIDLR